jgi:2-methylisocitrate lyase-like PEP mutase family enzyme
MKRRHQPAVTTMAALVLATIALELAGFRGLAIVGAGLAFVLGVAMLAALWTRGR